MNYIIHKADDLGPQTHTCSQHADPTLPCAPDCSICLDAYIAKHLESLASASREWRKNLLEEYYHKFYSGFDPGVGESESVLPVSELAKYSSSESRLTMADIIQVKAELELNDANNQIENLRELLTNALAELERACPLIDAAYALTKDPAVMDLFWKNTAMWEFRMAVAKYKSVDASAAKS